MKKPVRYLDQVKGPLIKPCPGAKNQYCCNLVVVSQVLNCPFDCSYCFLHTYYGQEEIVIVRDEAEIMAQVQAYLAGAADPLRVCTGEFSDSLALPEAISLGTKLVNLFAAQTDHLLELKTKSDHIEKLLGLEHNGRTIISWSVNPEKIVTSEEPGAASLKERLIAAKRIVRAGYSVAFHFDPLIHYQGWENDYREVVDQIFTSVPAQSIAWISLGALRFPPKMREKIEKNFPHSKIALDELAVGEDNKLRYPAPIREELFQKLNGFIRAHSKAVYLYLCMESLSMWRQTKLKNQPTNRYAAYFKYSQINKD